MHDLILYTTDDGQAALQLRASAWATPPASAKLLISLLPPSTPDQSAASPTTVKQSLTAPPAAGRQIRRRTPRDTTVTVRQP